MLQRKANIFFENWLENRKTALLVTGSRQVGKTYFIQYFAKKHFKHIVEINFAFRTDLIDSFVRIKNAEQLLIRLSAIDGANLVDNETLIFFDEIQLLYQRREELRKNGQLDPAYQDLVTTMKALTLQTKYRYVLSGSLLGIILKNVVLNPTGYLDVYKMYPLDFEEYLYAKGVGIKAIEYVQNCFENKEKVDDEIHKLFLDYFHQYVLIGGMPRIVEDFLNTKNLYNVQVSGEQIIKLYEADITTYIEDEAMKLRVKQIYQAMPSELNNPNKRFVSSHVIDPNYLKRKDLLDEYLWLTTAGIAIPVYNVDKPEIPLLLTTKRKTLKLFLNDIGLLDTMLFSTGTRDKLLNREININYGAPYENVVAQQLVAHGFDDRLYYYNSKKHGEVDFLIEKDGRVLPLEIKSGKPTEMNRYNHYALNNMISLYDVKEAYVFGETNVEKETDVISQLPIYMIAFLTRS